LFISIKYKYIILYSILTIIPILLIDTVAYQFLTHKLRNNIIESHEEIVTQTNNMLSLLKDAKIDVEKSEQRKIIYHSLANSVLGRGSEFVISNQDGHLIYTTNAHLASKELHIKAIHSEGRSGNYLTSYLQVERLAVYSYNPVTNWYLVVFTPTDYIFAKIEYIEKLMIVLITVSVILVMVLIFVISSHLTSPIHKLKKAMQRIENGNLSIEAEKNVFIKDEIWQISLSFKDIVNKLNTHMYNEYLFRIKSNEAKFRALQSQINPHFLHNTLETINSIARVEKVPLIAELSMSLSKMFRYNTLNESKYVLIRDEMNHIDHYLNVQLIRFNGQIQKKTDIDPEIMDYKIVKFILQPIIENCFVHAFTKIATNGLISIIAFRIDRKIVIEIHDNGNGMDAELINEVNKTLSSWEWNFDEGDNNKQKVGIYNVNSRIRMAFGKEFGLHLKPNYPCGLSVIVTLPLTKGEGISNV
jgi:sensor histidine kinase YesM